jgi:hypothetical protein
MHQALTMKWGICNFPTLISYLMQTLFHSIKTLQRLQEKKANEVIVDDGRLQFLSIFLVLSY